MLNLYDILLEIKKQNIPQGQLGFDFGDDADNTNITLTREWVKEHYNKYNQELFDGQLDDFDSIMFSFFSDKSCWGRGGVNRHFWKQDGTLGYERTVLELNGRFSYKEEDACGTLVHEMVHIYEHTREPKYIAEVKRWRSYTSNYPKDGHGTIFYREANRLKAYGFNIQRFVTKEESANARLNGDDVQKIKDKHQKGLPVIIEIEQDGSAFIAKVLTQTTINKWKEHLHQMLPSQKRSNSQPLYVNLYYAQNVGLAGKDIPKTKVGEYGLGYDKKAHQSGLEYLQGKYDLVFGETLLSADECKITQADIEAKEQYEAEQNKKKDEAKNKTKQFAQQIASNIDKVAEEIMQECWLSISAKNKVPCQSVNTTIGEVSVWLPLPSKYATSTHITSDCKLYLWTDDKKISKIIYLGMLNKYPDRDQQLYNQGKQTIINLINQAINNVL